MQILATAHNKPGQIISDKVTGIVSGKRKLAEVRPRILQQYGYRRQLQTEGLYP